MNQTPKYFLTLFLLLALTWVSGANEDLNDSYRGEPSICPATTLVGFGASQFEYKTNWSAVKIGPTLQLAPIHVHNKTELQLFVENRSMFNFGPIHMDIKGEVRFGVLGETKQKYIPDPLTVGTETLVAFAERDPNLIPGDLISETGTNWAGNAQFKWAYPLGLTPRLNMSFFTGLGLTFILLEQSGNDKLNSEYQNPNLIDLSYNSGWNEFSLYSPFILGLSLDFETWSIIVDYQRSVWGSTFTSWTPTTPETPDPLNPGLTLKGEKIKSVGQTYQGVSLTLGFKLGR